MEYFTNYQNYRRSCQDHELKNMAQEKSKKVLQKDKWNSYQLLEISQAHVKNWIFRHPPSAQHQFVPVGMFGLLGINP